MGIWNVIETSLGHWNALRRVAATVLLTTSPMAGLAGMPSAPRMKLNALESACCSNCGSISTNQGVFCAPAKIVGKLPAPEVGDQIRPGGSVLFALT